MANEVSSDIRERHRVIEVGVSREVYRIVERRDVVEDSRVVERDVVIERRDAIKCRRIEEVGGVVKGLTDQFGTEDHAVALDQAAIGLMRKGNLGDASDQQRIDHAGDHCEHQQKNQRRKN